MLNHLAFEHSWDKNKKVGFKTEVNHFRSKWDENFMLLLVTVDIFIINNLYSE